MDPYDCVLFSSNKGLKCWYMLQNGWTWKTSSERSQTEKAIYYMTPVIRIIQKRQIHRDKSILVVARRWGEEKRKEWLLNGYGASCEYGENVLELDRDGCCIHVNVLNSTELYNLVWLIVCYVNFTSIKKNKTKQKTPEFLATAFCWAGSLMNVCGIGNPILGHELYWSVKRAWHNL